STARATPSSSSPTTRRWPRTRSASFTFATASFPMTSATGGGCARPCRPPAGRKRRRKRERVRDVSHRVSEPAHQRAAFHLVHAGHHHRRGRGGERGLRGHRRPAAGDGEHFAAGVEPHYHQSRRGPGHRRAGAAGSGKRVFAAHGGGNG